MLSPETHTSITEEIVHAYLKAKPLNTSDMVALLDRKSKEDDELLFKTAYDVATKNVGELVHLRGIIEFSNCCDADCLYCGIRKSADVERFTLSEQSIVQTAREAMKMYPGVLLQSGEIQSDAFVDRLIRVVNQIKQYAKEESPLGENFRIIISVGELTKEQYAKLHAVGASRSLLRIETTNPQIFRKIHDEESSLMARHQCLVDQKELNYHVGTGVLIGLPDQTLYDLAKDVQYFKHLGADMIGMGPLLIAKGTPMERMYDKQQVLQNLHTDSLFDTVRRMIAVTRMHNPKANISATTAMEVLEPQKGRVKAILSGANVVMPIMTPVHQKVKYSLYEGKSEAQSNILLLKQQITQAGRQMNLLVAGDPVSWVERQKK